MIREALEDQPPPALTGGRSARVPIEAGLVAAVVLLAVVLAGWPGRWLPEIAASILALVGCARFLLRYSTVDSVPSIGVGAAVLGAASPAMPAPLLLAAWTTGSIIACAVLDRRLLMRPLSIAVFPLVAAAYLSVRELAAGAGAPAPVAIATATAAFVLVALLVAELQARLCGDAAGAVLGRLRPRPLLLAFGLNTVLAVLLVAGASLLDALAVLPGTRFGTVVMLILFGLIVLAATSAVEHRALSRSFDGLSEAALQLPWAMARESNEQILRYAAEVVTADRFEVVDARPVGPGIVAARFRDADGVERFLVAGRGRDRAPFTERDARALRAVAHLGAETLRVRRSTSELEREAYTDELTGLPNYRAFQAALFDINASRAADSQLAVVYVDLDGFKAVNDRYGHEVGNRMLQVVARRLRGAVRPSDRPARVGGDEFVVILPDVGDAQQAEVVAGRIREELAEPYVIGEHVVLLTVSTGVAHSAHPLGDPTLLVEQADERMYSARGRALHHGAPGEEVAVPIDPLGSRLNGAVAAVIDERRLWVAYQPVIDNVLGRVVSVEALVRGEDPVLGPLEPGLLVHEARRLGRLHELTAQVLELAFAEVSALQPLAPELRKLHVNIEVDQLLDERLRELLERLRAEYPSIELTLELTENSLNRASLEVMSAVSDLASQGIAFALDDFGQAYSSVLAIVQYRFQVLKIDRSLLRDLQDHRSQQVVRALVLLARKLRVQAVVEGVENQSLRDQLAQLGVRYMQGYYFGRPVAAQRLRLRLERHGLDEGRASKPALDG